MTTNQGGIKFMKHKIFFHGKEVIIKPPSDEPIKPQNLNPYQDGSETHIVQPTELGEAIKEINKDVTEVGGKMSSIDTKARITNIEKMAYHAFGSLISLNFFSKSALFIIRSGLRYSVSIDGKGRTEIVDIVRGVKDAESKSGFIEKLGGIFAGKGSPPQ